MTKTTQLHILEYNYKDERGPECHYNWHHNVAEELLEFCFLRMEGKCDEWMVVCVATDECYEDAFKWTKEKIINHCKSKIIKDRRSHERRS